MNKKEFLKQLDNLLSDLPADERKEILFDYEEHFRIGLEEGKKEEEIIESLGNPKTIAKQYRVNYIVNQAEANPSPSNILKAVFASLVLGFFNIVFVLGPFIGVAGVLIGFFAASISIVFGGVSVFFKAILDPAFLAYSTGANLFLGIGLTSSGLLFTIGNCYLAKWLYIGTIKYLKMNLKMILNK